MYELIPIALLLGVYASYTDLKRREIDVDWFFKPLLSFSIAFWGMIGLREEGNLLVGLGGLIGAGIGFVIGITHYFFHAWGGGDIKLLILLGALIPFAHPVLTLNGYANAPYPFIISVFINSFIITLPVYLAYVSKHYGSKGLLQVIKMPYAPSLLIGMIIALLWGDLWWASLHIFI